MIDWLTTNFGTIITGTVVFGLLAAALIRIIQNHKEGNSIACSGCSGCSGCPSTGKCKVEKTTHR
jgi:hypothetical protein